MAGDDVIRVGLFGPYGFGNLGDAALVEAAISGLRRNIPNLEICGICQHPENATRLHNIEMHSIYRVYPRLATQANVQVTTSAAPAGVTTAASAAQQTLSAKDRAKKILKSNPITHRVGKAARAVYHYLSDKVAELIFVIKIYKKLRRLDLLVMPGSGQLNEEWGGPWRYPYSLFRWCLLARLAGCKIAFLSVGAGTVSSFWGRFFCKSALRLAHYKSFRDENTRSVVESWGIYDGLVVPDLAFSLALGEEADLIIDVADARPTVGINPIAYCDPRSWHEKDPVRYNQYIDKLSSFCTWLIDEGYRIHFIPNEIRMDNWVIDDVLRKMGQALDGNENIERPDTKSYRDVFKNLSQCDYVVASRFHGLLFSFLSKRPIVTIAFHFKLSALAKAMGQERYCLDIATFQLQTLKSTFVDLVEHKTEVSALIAEKSNEYPLLVEQQFRAMRALLN